MKRGILALAVLAVLAAAAQAGPRDDVVNELVKCTDIVDSAERLACFDRGTPALRAVAGASAAVQAADEAAAQAEPPKATALAEPPPVAPPPVAPPPVAPQAPQEVAPSQEGGSWLSGLNPFGGIGSVPKPTARQMAYQPIGQEILPITIGVKEFYVPSGGAFMVTLANGQVWRAVHGYPSPPKFREGKTNMVVIDHAMLGGNNLSVYGNSVLYKVERVQ